MTRPRALCSHCKRNPVKRAGRKTCSLECGHAQRSARIAAARPLCKHCALARVKSRGRAYCSTTCANLANPREGELAAASQKIAHARVIATVLEELRAHVSADGTLALSVAVKAVLRHRRIGYQRGWGAMWARARRSSAARLAS